MTSQSKTSIEKSRPVVHCVTLMLDLEVQRQVLSEKRSVVNTLQATLEEQKRSMSVLRIEMMEAKNKLDDITTQVAASEGS